MYQCLGLGNVENGGCGEDWYHTGCVVGLKPDWYEKEKDEEKEIKKSEGDKQKADNDENGDNEDEEEEDPPLPPGFPDDDAFDTFLCWKCVEAFPWIKRYAGTDGFLAPVFHEKPSSTNGVNDKADQSTNGSSNTAETTPMNTSTSVEDGKSNTSNKRKAEESDSDTVTDSASSSKKLKTEDQPPQSEQAAIKQEHHECKYAQLPPPPQGRMSLFLQTSFRDHLCRCPSCFPNLAPHPQLLEEEDAYEPPVSEEESEARTNGTGGTGSLLDRGEQALNNVDRVRAIGMLRFSISSS